MAQLGFKKVGRISTYRLEGDELFELFFKRFSLGFKSFFKRI
jgi:hypothetical protein